MSTITITRDAPGKVLVKFDLPNLNFSFGFSADEFDLKIDPAEFLLPGEEEDELLQEPVVEADEPVESPAEKRRRRAKEYYEANKEKKLEYVRKRYYEKKALKAQEITPTTETEQEEHAEEQEEPKTRVEDLEYKITDLSNLFIEETDESKKKILIKAIKYLLKRVPQATELDNLDRARHCMEFTQQEPVESREDKKRRLRKAYYQANKERLSENSRKKYQEKKALKQQVEEPAAEVDDEEDSLEFDYDPSLSLEENATEAAQREYRQNYYQNRIKEVRQWYQDNKDRVAKRQQTDEVRSRFREQYHNRRANMTKQQIAAKNAIAVAQRKVRNAKLRAKYPGMKLKDAKAAQKAAVAASG